MNSSASATSENVHPQTGENPTSPEANTGAAPEGWVRVELSDAHRYRPDAMLIELRGPDDKMLPIWVTAEQASAAAGVVRAEGRYSPLFHAQDLMANLVNQLGGRVREARLEEGPEREIRCRLTVTQRGREIEALCRPGDGVVLARRFGAPIYVEERLYQIRVNLPNNWHIEAVDAERVTLSRIRYSLGALLAAAIRQARMTILGGLGVAAIAFAFKKYGLMGVGLIPLLQAAGTAVWLAMLRETWLVEDNALEVRRSVLGVRRKRRYVGGRLHLSTTSSPGFHAGSGAVDRLWVTERGRSRMIASGEDWDDAEQLARFVSRYTGWPIDAEDTREARKRV